MDSSIGTCRCPEETHVARETRDGWVCISLRDLSSGGTAPLYFVCALPEGAGFKISLNDPSPSMGAFPVGCTVGSSATIEPVQGLHGGGACMWPSDGEYIGDVYDCIHTSPHVSVFYFVFVHIKGKVIDMGVQVQRGLFAVNQAPECANRVTIVT